ncbi:hypothetical protein [Nonomuraea sp. NPDC049158]|uniref:hypothetical protein n=1 Tax=Nonomuraea sp. NPDC049158 TaxID=3155649 RepID=UPI00340D298B
MSGVAGWDLCSGAGEILVGSVTPADPVFGVLDNMGGDVLAEAFGTLADGGG